MSLNEQIRQVWKDSGLTMEDFGARIGIKRSAVSTIVNGKSNPSDQTIRSISREFGVREEWLRTGEGEKSTPAPEDALDALLDSCGLPRLYRGLFQRYAKLPEDAKRELERMIEGWATELSSQQPTPEDTRDWRDKNPSEWTEQDEEIAVAEFRRQWRDEKNRRQEAEPSGGPPADRLSG